jgi:hypothetical protein
MTIQFKRTAVVLGALLSTIAFSVPASAAAMAATGGYNREFHTMGMMKMLDGNGDHMVSHDEFTSYYGSVFDELDADKDGAVDAKEWVGNKGSQTISIATGGYSSQLRTIKMMGNMDADGDHKVTKAEFLAYHDSQFTAMDAKGNGMVDAQNWLRKQTNN